MTPPNPDQLALIQLAKVLSNPIRLRMLEYLSNVKMAQCTSFTRMIGVSQPQASRHLRKMLECGIVEKQLLGKTFIYTLNLEVWKLVRSLWTLTPN